MDEWSRSRHHRAVDSNAPERRADIAIGTGRGQWVAILGGLLFTVFGISLAASPRAGTPGVAVGIVTAAIFGSMALWTLLQSRRPGSLWLIAEDGIRFPKQGYPTIPWSEVTSSRITSIVGQRFLAIDIAHPESVMQTRGPFGRWTMRRNLARQWGVIAFPETQAPCRLEDLQAEIGQRQATSTAQDPGPPAPARGERLFRWLIPELAVAAQGVGYLLGALSGPTVGRALIGAGLGAALLGGAWLIRRKHRIGIPLIGAIEAVVVVVIVAGGNADVNERIGLLFFPACAVLGLLSATRGPGPERRSGSASSP